MSQQTKSALTAWFIAFCTGLGTILTQAMASKLQWWQIDPLAILAAAVLAVVAVSQNNTAYRTYPEDRRRVEREERKDDWEEHG